ncbi:MAG TPA: plasmid pRiA4b ORF-3 family protein [Rhizomicrobium sp.]|jgi:hypothetical protein|nr:plasmid pRiA4b ORF-3 family protein [Rhizomicrobium sp.]
MAAGRKSKPAKGGTVTLKVTLRDTKPPVWRRLVLPDSMTLGGVSEAIQAAMGWDGGHLHMFEIGETRYGDLSFDEGEEGGMADENRLTLAGLRKSGVTRFHYIYDFGDNWEHMVEIEKPATVPEGIAPPACIAGRRACPPDDCGGPFGYHHLLEVLADPAHPDYRELRGWMDKTFDPEAFSVDTTNRALAARFRGR